MHMLLDDESSAMRIMKQLCKTWLLHYDDIDTCIQTFFDDVFFAPIQLTLTKENIAIWPAVNALLTLQNTNILSAEQMSIVRDVPKNAGTFFALRVGVVADTPMWTSCVLNQELDDSTGNRLYLLKGFLFALLDEIKQCDTESTLCCMVNQLRISLLSSVSSALHVHACKNRARVDLLQVMQHNLQSPADLNPDTVINTWLNAKT
jgi:hypothetical protein